MKKLSLILLLLFASSIAFSQYVPGTALDGNRGTNGTLANGLTTIFSVTGEYTLSADGAGSNSNPYSISVDKPNAQATVFKAYLMATPVWSSSIANNCITLAGNSIVWDASIQNSLGGINYYKDVTSIVAPIINVASSGINNLIVTECNSNNIDGVALLVVFADPGTSSKTISIKWGALNTAGDNFSITLAEPVDLNDPNAVLDMGLGIGFGYQEYNGPDQQYSIINVNGTRLSTSAGGSDDGIGTPQNGKLITVGGIGDLNTNPLDPFSLPNSNTRYDDELYGLLPFINATTTNINVTVSNPSNDDNIFLAYFVISGEATFADDPPADVPLSPWAIIFGVFLIGAFMVFSYKRSVA